VIILDDQDHFPGRWKHERMVKEFLPPPKLSRGAGALVGGEFAMSQRAEGSCLPECQCT
jgi:hypothetical protein